MADVRALIVKGGVVVNAVLASEAFATSQGWRFGAGTEAADIGWTFRDGFFSAPAPVPAPVPPSITDRQFFQALAERKIITWTEAEEAVGSGQIPASMVALVNQIPETNDQRARARVMLRGAMTFDRTDPLTGLIRQLYGWTEAQVDDLWRQAATL